MTISFPITAGFGSSQFYVENKGFGFFSGGVNASVALPVPAKYGTWAFNAGVTYYRLAEQTAWVYDISNPIDKNRVVYQAGIGATF